MWLETPVFAQDLENFCGAAFIPWEKLRRKTIFVTGATGLIGYTLVSGLLYASRKRGLDIKVLALVRSLPKAQEKYAAQLADGNDLQFVVGSVEQLPPIAGPIDYIVHGASQTASRAFVEHPVETINTAVNGTQNILELARQKQVQGMVYLSSMEVYGQVREPRLLAETDLGDLDSMQLRSSYPQGKRMSETLCAAYAAEYGVPVAVARLAQTFGAGVDAADNRVFAQFLRSARAGEDIVLLTKGASTRMYAYTMDAATALMTLLLKGEKGRAYNVANKETYSSVYQMAELVAQKFSTTAVPVSVRVDESTGAGKRLYPPDCHWKLDVSALEALGWKPTVGLKEMYKRMLRAM